MTDTNKSYDELMKEYMKRPFSNTPENLKKLTNAELADELINTMGADYENQMFTESIKLANKRLREEISGLENGTPLAEYVEEGNKTIGEYRKEYEENLKNEKFNSFKRRTKDKLIEQIMEQSVKNYQENIIQEELQNTTAKLMNRKEKIEKNLTTKNNKISLDDFEVMQKLSQLEATHEVQPETQTELVQEESLEVQPEVQSEIVQEESLEAQPILKEEVSPEMKDKVEPKSELEEFQSNMQELLKDESKEKIIDHTSKQLFEQNKKIQEMQKQMIEFKKQMNQLTNQNSNEVNHFRSKTKSNFATKAFNKAKEGFSTFIGQMINKGISKAEDFKLEGKKNYHERFQKTRAFLKTVNDFTVKAVAKKTYDKVLKPAGKFSVNTYKKSKKSFSLVSEKMIATVNKVHKEANNKLNSMGNFKPSLSDYTVMFAVAATEKSAKKIYEVSGAKKAMDVAKHSETVKQIKKATTSVTSKYHENVKANEAKLQAVQEKIEVKQANNILVQ